MSVKSAFKEIYDTEVLNVLKRTIQLKIKDSPTDGKGGLPGRRTEIIFV